LAAAIQKDLDGIEECPVSDALEGGLWRFVVDQGRITVDGFTAGLLTRQRYSSSNCCLPQRFMSSDTE
jgi:hypothetical protein